MISLRRLGGALFRCVLFWTIAIGTFWKVGQIIPLFHWNGLAQTFPTVIVRLINGDIAFVAQQFGRPEFSSELASAIAAFAVGLLVSFGIMHTLAVRIAIAWARRRLSGYKDRRSFAAAYEEKIYAHLVRHPLIGNAWKQFDETLLKHEVPDGGIIRNTVRPQSLINYSVMRDQLIGLKFLGQIGGYFVGLGLLLTFIGIVLALQTAGPAVDSGSAEQMKGAMAHLLKIASFKFSTSIAGLTASLLFSLVSRFYVIIIEGGIARFCETAEHQMLYTPPQAVTFAMHEVAKEQRDQLKEINSDRYFTRIAEHVSPLLEQALSKAVTPVISEIGKSVSSSMQGSAGVEMTRLGETLAQMQTTLESTRHGLQGSGEDFARRMTEAAENLNRLVENAGRNLENSAEQSRVGLTEVMAALKEAFAAASTRVQDELGAAANGATGQLEAVMGQVLAKLESQVTGFTGSVAKVQEQAATSVSEAERQIKTAQEQATAVISATAGEVAKAMESGLAEVLQRVRVEIDRLEAAMRAGQAAYERQASAIGDVAGQTRGLADAFSRTAQDVRAAAAPLAQTGADMAAVSRQMSDALEQTVTRFDKASLATNELVETLRRQIQQLGELWAGYKGQFDKVDQDLGRAVQTLAEATGAQSDRLTGFVRDVDKELSNCLDRLTPLLSALSESSGTFSEGLDELTRALSRVAAE